MHVHYKETDAIKLFLHYPKNDEPHIKRDVKVVDALKKAKEIGLENSIDAPFLVIRG